MRLAVLFLLFMTFFAHVRAGAEGDIKDLKDFQYWDNGKIKQCTVYSTQGKLNAKVYCRYDGTVEKMERYDSNGNKTEESLYDNNGKLKIGIDGWAAMRWWYDGPLLISQIAYDENGIPLERKQYSDSGRLVLRQYREDIEDSSPFEGANMTMILGGNNVKFYKPAVNRSDRMPVVD